MKTNENNMTPLSTGKVTDALAKIGSMPACRGNMITLLKSMEPNFFGQRINAREEITGPIVDAMYSDSEVIKKTLDSGIEIFCRYKSKIVRDFVMADDERPDHVWEPQTTKLLLSLGRNAKQAVIGGAYFGDHAILLARAMSKNGGVCHCFEMNPEQCEMLQLNARRNKVNNIVLNHIALWETDDNHLILQGKDSHACAQLANNSDDPDACLSISINTYGQKLGLESIDLIMLDIEGAEFAALKGSDRYLKQPAETAPNIIFEVHCSYVDWSNGLENTDIVQFLENFGYSIFSIRDYQSNVPMKKHPVEVIPVRETFLAAPPHGFNMLAIKDMLIIESNNLKICSGVSPKLLFHEDPKLHRPIY